MDYTMESLSVGDIRMCDEKFAAQGPGYEGIPVDDQEKFIQRNLEQKGSQHGVSMLRTSSQLHMTLSNNKQLNVVGTASSIHGRYGIESNMMVENVYQMREESGSHFDRPCVYGGENKITRNADEVLKQTATDIHSSFYYNEDSRATKNMNVEHGDCLGRYSLNSVNDMLPVGKMDLKKDSKIMAAGGGDYESVVSEFLPETPRSKEQYYLFDHLERNLHNNEAVHNKNFHYQETPQEENPGYAQIIPQHSNFVEMVFQRAEHFGEAQEARNLLYLENSSTHEETYCPNTDVVDISKRGNVEISFESSSKDTEDINGSSAPVDSNFSERMESARAVAALTSLQDEVDTTLETEHSRVPVLKQNETAELEACASNQNGDISSQSYLSKSTDLVELDLQPDSTKTVKTNHGRESKFKEKQVYLNSREGSAKQKAAEINEGSLMDEDMTLFRETGSSGHVHKKGKGSIHRVKGINNENKVDDEKMEHGNKGKVDDSDNEEAAQSLAVPTATNGKSFLTEEDAASVRSIESPSSPPKGIKKKFKCKFCNRSWKFRKDLNKHMKTHKETKKYACSICSSSFINRTLLKKHLLTHSDVKLLTCPECPATFSTSLDLKHHRHKHATVKIFSCTECSYAAKCQKDLSKHMLKHSASKVYNCQFCKFSSKRKYSLQRHVKTAHSSTQVHECSVCSFQTSAVDSFKVHVAMHVSTRTTSCIICGAVIKKRPNLIEHLLSHSSDLDTTCKECDETYTTSHEYMLHLLSHKNSTSTGQEEANQASDFDLSNPSLLTGSTDSTSGTFGFLARKSKIIMDTPTMEARLSQMSTVASRLADMTKVVTLLNEKSKVVFQLAEISTLATELAVISGNVLQSYKNTYAVTGDAKRSKAKVLLAPDDIVEDSSFVDDDDDDDEMSSAVNLPAAKIKEEFQDNVYSSAEAGMQIQVDLNGEPVSCVQKDDPLKPGTVTKTKGDKHLKCTRCNLTFTDTRSLKRHLMAHDNVRPYSCDKCGQTFRRNEHLKKHMVTHSDERPFMCKECPYAAKTEHRMKIHMLCHSQTKAYACQHCTYTARTNYELNHHMKRHEPRSCSQCSFVCYSRAELKKHVFTHSSFDCNECSFTTNDRAEYTKHMKKHTVVQHLCCELCGYSCDTMKKFKYHKLRHENKTPYQCPDCDYKCSSRASFDCHRLKHAGLKPYLCSFCGAAFRKTSHLNQHLLIHKDEKAFRCSECGYSCRTKHNLKEHEMTHSGEKPFACKYCSFSCRRNKALQLHMLKHESSAMMIPPLQLPVMQFTHLQMPLQMPMIPSGL